MMSVHLLTPGFFPKQVLVPGNMNNGFLDNLIPDTPYSVSVSALYADGEGPPVKGNGKTCKYPGVTYRSDGRRNSAGTAAPLNLNPSVINC